MGFLGGILFITMGIIQIVMRGHLSRAQASSNSVVHNGLASRPGYQRFTTGVNLAAGIFWTALGLLTIVALACYGG